ncbi:AMP-binding protein [Streptomyces afghaniensis]|uniref:AMP-binding protein n=1 Tax=Streptomyces afghaniensis TaxID=66865 RepID=UPI00277FDCE3|nr:AMP-binding protein [Streptomyces afghaniensis]MDQ1018915.1 long-chain acyl-CoA synthetase [Streptomyces afghaniensis]
MRSVIDSLARTEVQNRPLIELTDVSGQVQQTYTYRHVRRLRDRLAGELDFEPGTLVGLVAGNSPAWVVADLALLLRGLVEVPVPLEFSAEQAASLLDRAKVCLADEAGLRRLREWGLDQERTVLPIPMTPGPDAAGEPIEPPDNVIKVIHTSGTTGVPKGVRIRGAGLEELLDSFSAVVPDGVFRRYLSLVPFSLLIEQVTAIYLPLQAGGTLVMLPPDIALLGTAGSRAEEAVGWLRGARPTAALLPPAVVAALDKAAARIGRDASSELLAAGEPPFLMAGGAPVDPAALRRLSALGIDVYEGYGLSENSSVVASNRPGENAPGTVGRPLPHCQVSLGPANELLVKSSSLFAGYTIEDPTSRPVDEDGWLHTGDRASIDELGRITILGRLKSMIITSHGRNISPEWVEGRLRSCLQVRDCVVYGDGLEHLVVLVLAADDASAGEVRSAVLNHASQELAETDRPEEVIVVTDTPELRSKYFTVTGRPRRKSIYCDLVQPRLTVNQHEKEG